MLRPFARWMKNKIKSSIFRTRHLFKEQFECPVCGYHGPFLDFDATAGCRKHAICPNCRALERHRIQFLVVADVLKTMDTANMKMLHIAPEGFFRKYFSKRFGEYETADLNMENVDHNVDLQDLPFDDKSYDLVFASHVLEHVPDDRKAISEIRRVLKDGGIAVLPVPLISDTTIEYPEPNPYEEYHVRAPGADYFDRYERHFARVERFSSDSLPEKYQLYIYEDRSIWPTEKCPLRPSMEGKKHIDIVPVCYA